MQHHAHITRTAPQHMRAAHHMAVPPSHSQSQSHMPPLNMSHAAPPTMGQQQQMPHQHQQQQQQQQPQQHTQQKPAKHLSNVAIVTAGVCTAITTGTTSGSTTSHMRDHQTRLNQQPFPQRQHQHTQSLHTSTQLQKLRQQHQHINNNSINNNNSNISNNNSTNKNIYQQQQSHQYNGSSKTHANTLQIQTAIQQQPQQQKLHTQPSIHYNQHQQPLYHQQQQQQQQQHTPHLRSVPPMAPQQSLGHLQQQKSQPKIQQQQQQSQYQSQPITLNTSNNVISVHPPPLAQQQPTLLTPLTSSTGAIAQTNNNNNNKNLNKTKCISNISGSINVCSTGGGCGSSGDVVPKTILQNPNRITKPPLQNSLAVNKIEINKEDVKRVSMTVNKNGSNLCDITSKEASVTDVREGKLDVVGKENNLKNMQITNQRDAAREANKENVKCDENNGNLSSYTINVDVCDNNKDSNVLSNIDSSVAKNSREKTPMCHVNELARFNKITHQYRLTSEKGPAHCKRFTVTLKLGNEEYTAEGFKIKKAQHLAATEALANTKYKHPVPKVIRRNADGDGHSSRSNITPTVELNALAMKLGQQTYYLLDPRQNMSSDGIGPPPDAIMPPRFGGPQATPHMLPQPNGMVGHHHYPPPHLHMMEPSGGYGRRNGGPYATGPPPPPPSMHSHSMNGPCMPPRYGPPPQPPHISHKYNLHQRYPLMPPPHMGAGGGGHHNGMPPPLPPPYVQETYHHRNTHQRCYGMYGALARVTLVVGNQKFLGSGHTLQQAKHDAAARALQVLKVQATEQQNELLNNSSQEENDKKSPISLVHEIAIQRSMTVHFKVLREEGPAHMKKFVTACIVGDIVTEGEGNGKKTSKKRAAHSMLEELRKLPPLTPTKPIPKRVKGKPLSKTAAGGGDSAVGGDGNERRKRGSTSIKQKIEVDNDVENPITRLTQLQQNRKEKDPVFELIGKNGNENARRRDFIVEVTASGMVARGTGNSKKLAKRNAAQNLLLAMGVSDGESIEINVARTVAANTTTATATTTESIEKSSTMLQETDDVTAAISNCRKVPLVSTPAGKVPGILILRQNKKHAARKKECKNSNIVTKDDTCNKKVELTESISEEKSISQAPAVMDNVVDTVVVSPVAKTSASTSEVSNDAIASNTTTINNNAIATNNNTISNNSSISSSSSNSSGNTSKSVGVHMKDQLLYLANLMGFEVSFSDYPKGVHSEVLTIVTLSTNPPQICHGVGGSIEESQNDAARNALKILSELGLNNAAN